MWRHDTRYMRLASSRPSGTSAGPLVPAGALSSRSLGKAEIGGACLVDRPSLGHTPAVRINAKSDYAIRAMIEIATSDPEVRSCDAIAEAQGIPAKFLGTILTDLKRAGVITSHRGAEGGFTLARPARTITVADVIRAVDGPLASVQGQRPQDLDYEGNSAILQPLWVAVRASLRDVLESTTLEHLAQGQLPRRVARLTESDEAWKDH